MSCQADISFDDGWEKLDGGSIEIILALLLTGGAMKKLEMISLSDTVKAIRDELKEAQRGSDPDHPLIVEGIEVELTTVVTRGKKGEGKTNGSVGLSVLGFSLGKVQLEGSGAVSYEKAATQTIRLKLSAKSLNPDTGALESTQIGDEDHF